MPPIDDPTAVRPLPLAPCVESVPVAFCKINEKPSPGVQHCVYWCIWKEKYVVKPWVTACGTLKYADVAAGNGGWLSGFVIRNTTDELYWNSWAPFSCSL